VTKDLGMPFQHGAIPGLAITPDARSAIELGAGLIDTWRLDNAGAIRHYIPLGQGRFVQELIGSDRMLVARRTSGLPVDPDLVNANTGEVIDPLEHVDEATRVVGEPNMLVAAFDDGIGGQYDMAARQRVLEMNGSPLDFLPKGAIAVRGHVVLWNEAYVRGFAPTGRVDPSVFVSAGIRAVVASVDGSRLFTLESRGLTQRAPSGRPTERPPLPGIEAAASTADLLVVATNGRLQVLDAETLQPSGAEFPGTHGPVGRISIADDGQRMLLTGVDSTAELADLPTRRLLGDPIDPGVAVAPGDQSFSAVLAPDGQRIAYSMPGGAVIWDLHPETLRAAACRVAGRDLTRDEWARYLAPLGPPRPLCPG
jgi:hypothetical protein